MIKIDAENESFDIDGDDRDLILDMAWFFLKIDRLFEIAEEECASNRWAEFIVCSDETYEAICNLKSRFDKARARVDVIYQLTKEVEESINE